MRLCVCVREIHSDELHSDDPLSQQERIEPRIASRSQTGPKTRIGESSCRESFKNPINMVKIAKIVENLVKVQ